LRHIVPNNHDPFLCHCGLGAPVLNGADIPYLGNNDLQDSITRWLLTMSQWPGVYGLLYIQFSR
jgi:hypothetical protein